MSSLAARYALAVQSGKGTPASTGFHAMRSTRSSSPPDFTYEEARDEHGGAHVRASTQQSTPSRISSLINLATEGLLYPNAIGVILVGLGFSVNTTNNTTYYSHAFTKANVDSAKWLTVLHRVGIGAGQFERKISDVRLTQAVLTATRQNIRLTTTGAGINEVTASGTETVTADANNRILPVTGSITYGSLALGAPRQHTITISRPVDTEDQKLHSYGLADLPENGFEIVGQLRGLDLSFDSYKKLVWGGTGGTGPSYAAVTDSLTVKWESASNISGAAVPYSFQMALTKAEFRVVGSPEAQGNSIVRLDIDYRMVDDTSAAPVTFTLVNGVTSY